MKNFSFSRAMKGKGFYVVLAVSVLTIAAAGVITYKQTAERIENQFIGSESAAPEEISVPQEWTYDDIAGDTAQDVSQSAADVPKEPSAPEKIAAESETEPARQTATEPFIMPLSGEIIGEFSKGNLVKSETLGCWKTHDGVDIKGTLGDQVKSMTGGKVTEIYEDAMWGVCVKIDHGNGYEAVYCGLAKTVPVQVDQKVSAGTVIGALGDTAQAEIALPSHLHLSLKKNGSYVDPLEAIRR